MATFIVKNSSPIIVNNVTYSYNDELNSLTSDDVNNLISSGVVLELKNNNIYDHNILLAKLSELNEI